MYIFLMIWTGGNTYISLQNGIRRCDTLSKITWPSDEKPTFDKSSIKVDTGTNNPFINNEATKVAERILTSDDKKKDE